MIPQTNPTKTFRTTLSALCVVAIACVSGCSDPTEGKPKAVVNEVPAQATQESISAPVQPIPEAAPTEQVKIFALTDDSYIGFEGSKVTGTHTGGFGKYVGTVSVPDGDLLKARIEIEIDTRSLFSDAPGLTTKLKSADFFDVESFPTSTFTSTAIAKTNDGYAVTGNFNLHGVTKNITFPMTINLGQDKLTAETEFSIRRFDFDIRYPGKADDLIRDEVLILLDIEAEIR